MKKKTRDIKLSEASLIEVLPLVTQRAEHKKIFLGNKESGHFLMVSSYWKPLVKILKKPIRVKDILRKLRRRNKKITSTNLRILLLFLAQFGLIKKIDRHKLRFAKPIKYYASKKITPKKAKSFFTPFLVFLYSFFFSLSLSSIFIIPGLMPKTEDFFWHPNITICLLSSFIFSWILAVVHELAHFIVARFNKVNCTFSISNRFLFLVTETEYPDIFSVSKVKRLMIYSAGVFVDLVILGTIFVLLQFSSFSVLLFAFLKQISLIIWLGILWQFLFFMKTDFYFIVKEIVDCQNLYTLAMKRIKSWFSEKEKMSLQEEKRCPVATFYAFFILFGIGLLATIFFFYYIPIILRTIFGAIGNIFVGISINSFGLVLDGVTVLGIYLFTGVLLTLSIFKERSQ